jgi:hypothetical protein
VTDEQLALAAPYDIRYWYFYHDGKCPNCGLDLKSMHPLYSLYPHWAGGCKAHNNHDSVQRAVTGED